MEKIDVKGDNQHPLYSWLTLKENNGSKGSTVKWNFQKYLVDHRGKVLAKFSPRENPMGEKVTTALEKALATRGPYRKPPGTKKTN